MAVTTMMLTTTSIVAAEQPIGVVVIYLPSPMAVVTLLPPPLHLLEYRPLTIATNGASPTATSLPEPLGTLLSTFTQDIVGSFLCTGF